ncbi:MAG: hypothetical protein AB2A00_19540 [Myxococcota bacterium]
MPNHDWDDDIYNQSVLSHIAKVVREAERDAEEGYQHLQHVMADNQRLRSSMLAAMRHLERTCGCEEESQCRQRALDILRAVADSSTRGSGR